MERSPVIKVRLKFLHKFPSFVHRLATVTALSCCECLISELGKGSVQCKRGARHYHAGVRLRCDNQRVFGSEVTHIPSAVWHSSICILSRVQTVYVIPQKLVCGSYLSQFCL
jgi:hypothetical protein